MLLLVLSSTSYFPTTGVAGPKALSLGETERGAFPLVGGSSPPESGKKLTPVFLTTLFTEVLLWMS